MKKMSMAKFADSQLDNVGILSEGVAWKSLNSASERLEWPTGITRQSNEKLMLQFLIWF